MNQKYEYKIVIEKSAGIITASVSEEKLNKIFNKLAKDGWEYVDNRAMQSNEYTTSIIFIFKRDLTKS